MIHNEAEETTSSNNKVSVQNKKDGMMKGEGEGGPSPPKSRCKISAHVNKSSHLYHSPSLMFLFYTTRRIKQKVDFAAKMSTKNSPWLLRSTFSTKFLWYLWLQTNTVNIELMC